MTSESLCRTILLSALAFSVTDFVRNGWDVEQTIEFAKRLKNIGLDFVDCSSGAVVSNIIYPSNTYQIQWNASAVVQKEAGIATGAVGMIIDPLVAEKLLRDNWATFISVGRAMLNNPHWPYMAADKLANATTFKYPNQNEWCIGWKESGNWRKDVQAHCHNNSEIYEDY